MTDREVLEAIQRLLDGKVWTAGLLAAVAELLCGHGLEVREDEVERRRLALIEHDY